MNSVKCNACALSIIQGMCKFLSARSASSRPTDLLSSLFSQSVSVCVYIFLRVHATYDEMVPTAFYV